MIWSIFHYIFLNIEPGEKQFLYASIEARSSIFAIRAFSQNEGQSKKKIIFFRTNRSLTWLHGCGYQEQDYPRVEHFNFIISYHKVVGQNCIKEAGCCISTFT